MGFRRRRAGLGLGPRVVFGDSMRRDALGRVARVEVRLEPPSAGLGQILHDKAAGAPGAAAGGDDFADREAHQRRDLFRSLEVVMRRLFQSLALERDDALVARHLAARIDGEGHMAPAEQVVARLKSGR